MIAVEHKDMDEAKDIGSARLWRWLRIVGLSLLVLFMVGVVAGFLAAHVDRGHGFTTKSIAVLGGIVVGALLCGWLLLRELRKPTGEEPLTPRERTNRNLLIACGALGGVMGAGIMLAGGGLEAGKWPLFSNDPLPTWVAAVMVAIIGGLLPVISYFWHRTVDEQEADAYKTGALYALYVYMLGAPIWWFAWRGGFAPEPNGTIIYFATVLTVGAVWIWKKYR